MRKLRLVLIAVCAGVGLVLGGVWISRPREPVYQGKTVSEWLEPHALSGRNMHEIREIFHAMGKPAAPFLARAFDETILEGLLRKIYPKLPIARKAISSHLTRQSNRRAVASWGLSALGSNAVEVLPLIVKAKGSEAQRNMIIVLRDCAPHTSFESQAVKVLMGALTNTGTGHAQVAIESLVLFGQVAVPALYQATVLEEGHIRRAEWALERIDPEVAERAKAERRRKREAIVPGVAE